MKHIYAVENENQLKLYQDFVIQVQPRLNEYMKFLEKEYEVLDLPRTIVWTSMEVATNLVSDNPVPAYTNDYRVMITPELSVWREIYLKQLDALSQNQSETGCEDDYNLIKNYYEHELSEHNLLQVIGHELAHHSELFLDDFDSELRNGIWFEEGMVEYISRRYFLTEEEFEKEILMNQKLVMLLQKKYGLYSLEEFGASTYKGDIASIFYAYWRSFLAIKQIVDEHNGDVKAVFDSYHKWDQSKTGQTLAEWFRVEEFMPMKRFPLS